MTDAAFPWRLMAREEHTAALGRGPVRPAGHWFVPRWLLLNKTSIVLFSSRRYGMSVASEYEHAERVVTDVALLHDMAAGKLDTERVKEAAGILLEHKRREMPGVSVAVAARLLGVSRTTVEKWRSSGV